MCVGFQFIYDFSLESLLVVGYVFWGFPKTFNIQAGRRTTPEVLDLDPRVFTSLALGDRLRER